jgi:hypothetical protein
MNVFWDVLAENPLGSADDYAWSFSYHDLLQELNVTCSRLGIRLVPYQARHSGASCDRLYRERDQLEVMKRGRWATMASVMRYEKGGLLSKSFNNYPTTTQTWLLARERDIAEIMIRGAKVDVPQLRT